jgi:hypothetical protein
MDIDGPAAQREAELGCVSSEMAGWIATDQRITTISSTSGSGGQQQQESG